MPLPYGYVVVVRHGEHGQHGIFEFLFYIPLHTFRIFCRNTP